MGKQRVDETTRRLAAGLGVSVPEGKVPKNRAKNLKRRIALVVTLLAIAIMSGQKLSS